MPQVLSKECSDALGCSSLEVNTAPPLPPANGRFRLSCVLSNLDIHAMEPRRMHMETCMLGFSALHACVSRIFAMSSLTQHYYYCYDCCHCES